MVNPRKDDLDSSIILHLMEEAERRAEHAYRCGKPDCAARARDSENAWKAVLEKRVKERKELFAAGAAAALSATGI